MCHYLVQNIIFLLIPFLWWYFMLRKDPKPWEYDKTQSVIINFADGQGWLALFAFLIIEILFTIDKTPIFSSLLNWIGIQTCGF